MPKRDGENNQQDIEEQKDVNDQQEIEADDDGIEQLNIDQIQNAGQNIQGNEQENNGPKKDDVQKNPEPEEQKGEKEAEKKQEEIQAEAKEKEKEQDMQAAQQKEQEQQKEKEQQKESEQKQPEQKQPEQKQQEMTREQQLTQQMQQMQQQMMQMQQMMMQMQQQANLTQEERKAQQRQQREQQRRQQEQQRRQYNLQTQQQQNRTITLEEKEFNLDTRTKQYTQMAHDAKSRFRRGQKLPNGMEAKYYYAAVRDFHKDLKEKSEKISDPAKRNQYLNTYYTQEYLERYAASRVRDPNYRYIVDNYRSANVLSTYQKVKQMQKPGYRPYFGYNAFVESKDNEYNPASETMGINTSGELYTETYNEENSWEKFRQKSIELNAHLKDRQTEVGRARSTDEVIKQDREKLKEFADDVIREYGKESAGKGFVKEAQNAREYLNDIEKYGVEGANLRRICREKIEKAENQKSGIENQWEAADVVVAKTLMSKKGESFWERFEESAENPITKAEYDQSCREIEGMRNQVLRDPLFSQMCNKGTAMNEFSQKYIKAASDREKARQEMEKQRRKEIENAKKAREKEAKAKAESQRKAKKEADEKRRSEIRKMENKIARKKQALAK